MQKLDSESKTALRDAVSEIREELFTVADDTDRLTGCPRFQDLLQRASYQLGEAESELIALTNGRELVAA
jgi:hypothetical protein